MSEFENEEMNNEFEDVEVVEDELDEELEDVEDDAELEDAEDESEASEEETAEQDPDFLLFDKTNKAARLLRCRRGALQRELEEKSGKTSSLVRALKLLQLKPKMEQKEMADLLGMRLRELDAMLAEAEKKDIVARVEPEEPDMRKVVVMADEDAVERAEAEENKGEALVPGLSDEERDQFLALLDKVIDPLVALGLDEERGERGGFNRGGDRGGRGFGGRGGDRGGFHNDRGGFRGGRGGFGGRDNRGGDRGGFRNDRGGDRGGFRGNNDRGGFRGNNDRGGFGGRDNRGGDRGGFRGNNDRGGFRNDRGNDRGGFRGNNDRRDNRGGNGGGFRGGDRGGFRGGNRY